jgi:hypothetical protein
MLLAVAASVWLGLGGATFSALGVFLALIGTRTIRAWLASRLPPEAKSGGATGKITVATKARGKAGPGAGQEWSAEEWIAVLDRRIDGLAAEIDAHGHPPIDREIAAARKEIVSARSLMDRGFADLDAKGAKAERWNLWGLILAGIGALLQIGALVAAIIEG